jgi:peptidoglycan/xylan/chitin deacetylase (PgdA/CDA1 family)
MSSPPNTPDVIDCRFLFGSGAAEDICRESFAVDMRAAQLSTAFRAYYRLRSLIPLPVRQLLQRYRQVDSKPDWYLPTSFVSALQEIVRASSGGIPAIYPWPDDAKFAFVPTHDVETADGMRRIEQIADLEERLGFRSSWNIVPHKYPVDRGLLRDLQSRGFEIGVHGYNHDGKLFTSRSVFDSRVPAINAALEAFEAVGFRAPMVHRNLEWLQSLHIEYDASCFDADPYQAMPGGVGSVWPFMAGRFVELPYTLPQDHTLFVALNERDGNIWERKLDYIAQLGGMALFITHPDYLDSELRINAYRRLLEKVRDTEGMWHVLPRDAAQWWRERDALILQREADGSYRIDGPAADRARPAALRLAPVEASRSHELEWKSLTPATATTVQRSLGIECAKVCADERSGST